MRIYSVNLSDGSDITPLQEFKIEGLRANIKITGLYVLLIAVILIALDRLVILGLLHPANFLNWDALHYNWIKDNGYEGFRVAFFPLFPFLWKALHVGPAGMAGINALIFLTSFYFLIRTLKVTPLETLLYLSIPSFIFFYLPYSESVFFACSTLLFIGIKNKKTKLILLGLFLSTLARPAFTVFIPALIITELYSGQINKRMFVRIGLYLLVAALGLLLVGAVQHFYTGEWFKFFSSQQGWGNRLQIPELPLTSWAGGFIVKLDGVATLAGILAGGFLLMHLVKMKFIPDQLIPGEVIFALAYLGGITLSVLLFRGGSLFSLNRFVFAVPFIIVVLNFWIRQDVSIRLNQVLFFMLALVIFWLLFGSYTHILTFLKWFLLTVYLSLIITIKSDNKIVDKLSWILLIGFNFTVQILLFIRFLSGEWVG